MDYHEASVVPASIAARRLRNTQPPAIQGKDLRGDLVIACILDDLSMNSYGPEADFQQLTMRDWKVQLIACQPDLLFVESAWRGESGTWWNQVHLCGPELLGIIDWCKSRNIPTVFWNKEDPVHYSTFLNAASHFDFVFTTDIDCIPKYKKALGHSRVDFLPFAAQPFLHNPLAIYDRANGCSFAGSYYEKYPERNRDFNSLSPVIKDRGVFHIYDRNYGKQIEGNQFPKNIISSVVGTLDSADIAVAYKGYDFGLNLNSVKQSQSMFARRVFELLASGTVVISNYSRGLKRLLGDITLSTDDGSELSKLLADLDSTPNGSQRLKSIGLRKIFAEHTYGHRLHRILTAVNLETEDHSPSEVLLVSAVERREELMAVVAAALRQSYPKWRLILLTDLEVPVEDDRIVFFPKNTDSDDFNRWYNDQRPDLVGYLNPTDWYGPHYLTDIVGVFGWADVNFAGHSSYYQAYGKNERYVSDGIPWTTAENIPIYRGLLKINPDASVTCPAVDEKFFGLNVYDVQYLSEGAYLSPDRLRVVSDPELSTGMDLVDVDRYISNMHVASESGESDESIIAPSNLFASLGSVSGLEASIEDDGTVTVTSTLDEKAHQYLYSDGLVSTSVLPEILGGEAFFEATPGLNVMLAFIYYDESGTRLGHTMLANSRNTSITWPEITANVKVGIRALGPGTTRIVSYSPKPQVEVQQPPLSVKENLVITNKYPSYDSLYQNAFVASRVNAYAESGLNIEVFVVEPKATSTSFREYKGVEVSTGGVNALRMYLESNRVSRVLVHFLSPEMWAVLKDADPAIDVTVWIHGYEIQPSWRREFAFTTPEESAKAAAVSDVRSAMWKEVFEAAPSSWHFVFVSNYLALQSISDIGVELRRSQYSIIPNFIDTDHFAYVEKDASYRFKVLSIRPYASAVYANDLSVKAVLHLKDHSELFSAFEFTFYGDGPLFDETLEPIRDLPNVRINKKFLTHDEVAEAHRDNGIFLVPSRMDTQGVSRGEAMSSGLVPVTNAVAAIPEFVDENSGMVVDPEDYKGLAAALLRMAEDPDLFLALSREASNRVRSELNFEITIEKEMDVILRKGFES